MIFFRLDVWSEKKKMLCQKYVFITMRYVTYVYDQDRGLIYSCKYCPDDMSWRLVEVLCADNHCTDCPATEINNILKNIKNYFKQRDTWKETDENGQTWTVTLV